MNFHDNFFPIKHTLEAVPKVRLLTSNMAWGTKRSCTCDSNGGLANRSPVCYIRQTGSITIHYEPVAELHYSNSVLSVVMPLTRFWIDRYIDFLPFGALPGKYRTRTQEKPLWATRCVPYFICDQMRGSCEKFSVSSGNFSVEKKCGSLAPLRQNIYIGRSISPLATCCVCTLRGAEMCKQKLA